MKLYTYPTQRQCHEYLDLLIEWYRDKEKEKPQGISIHNFRGQRGKVSFNQISLYEYAATQKLIRDGFIEEDKITIEYQISFEGLCFEGYVKRAEKEKRQSVKQFWRPIKTAVIGAIAGAVVTALLSYSLRSAPPTLLPNTIVLPKIQVLHDTVHSIH